ncbi:MAG: HdeD family acid-resistance protein [Halobacteriota archaeon]
MSSEYQESSEMAQANPLTSSWRFLMGAGAVIAILGVLAIIFPFVTGVALTLLLGILAVIGGVAHFAHAFSAQGWSGALWQVLLGLLFVGAGIVLMANPVLGLASLTIILAAFFLAEGLIEVVMGFTMVPDSSRLWIVFSGVLSIIIAGLIFIGWPTSAGWAIGLLFGVNLLTSGITMVFTAHRGRQLPVEAAPASSA